MESLEGGGIWENKTGPTAYVKKKQVVWLTRLIHKDNITH